MQYISICAIVKNEAPYIEEWVEYHASLGVEKFYLYENFSEDGTLFILKKLATKYTIELNRIDGAPKQYEAYEDCLLRHRQSSRWIGFIDADEFMVPSMPLSLLLKEYEGYAGLAVHWYLFGSNGWQNQTPEPVVERFTKRQADVNPHIKCFVDPKRTIKCFTPHRFIHVGGFKTSKDLVDENYEPIPDGHPIWEGGSCKLIQCNHYVTKSYDECVQRRGRVRADTGTVREMPQFFHEHDRNEVEDFKARDIWRSISRQSRSANTSQSV